MPHDADFALAVLQSTTLITVARAGALFPTTSGVPQCNDLITNDAWYAILLMVITMTAGTAVIMWLGELITERGVGNGMSILIFCQVVATFPGALWEVGKSQGWWTFGVVLAIGLVIVATISNPQQTPSISAVVANRVGANPAAAYDLNAACAGFSYGLAQADALIRSGIAHYAVVVGAEKLSDVVDPTDRSISFLLGDGAGAVVVGPSDTPGIGPTVWGSDGSKADAVGMDHTLIEFRDGVAAWPTLRQEGPTVFRWAVWEMVKVARQALEAAGVEASDLAAFVPHQANMRIIDEFAKQLKLPESVAIARDIATTGNTSAASIPLATRRAPAFRAWPCMNSRSPSTMSAPPGWPSTHVTAWVAGAVRPQA